MGTKVEHREWTISSHLEQQGAHWGPWVEVERRPSEHEDGHIYHFFDIGYFDTEAAAHDRGIAWAKAWLDSNF